MKNLVIRTVFVLALLLTLGALFGVFHTTTTHAASLKPNINQTNCNGRQDLLQVYTASGGETCFANGGYTSVTIPSIIRICSGNNTANIDTTHGNYYFDRGACQNFPSIGGIIGSTTLLSINIL